MAPSVSTSADLLVSAVNEPGTISDAYRQFHNYSLGNQLLAWVQCIERGIQPGPIATFQRWKELGRYVRKGEKALTLCRPVTVKRKTTAEDGTEQEAPMTWFVYKPFWFVLAQTEGQPLPEQPIPSWDAATALAALDVQEIPFAHLDGNCLGYATGRSIAINPVNPHATKTRFHELAHVLLGHVSERMHSDSEVTPRNLRECEAESGGASLLRRSGAAGRRILPWIHTGMVGPRKRHPGAVRTAHPEGRRPDPEGRIRRNRRTGGPLMRAAVYARVSTADQICENQLLELRRYCEARGWALKEYVDAGVSGAKDKRPALDALLKDARRRRLDVLVCWRLDRLGRNLKHLITLLDDLQAVGVAFVSLAEGIDATTPAGRLQMHLLGAIAEFERDRIRERVLAGLRRARTQGRRLGRPNREVPPEAIQMAREGIGISEAAERLGVSRATAYRWLRQARADQNASENPADFRPSVQQIS